MFEYRPGFTGPMAQQVSTNPAGHMSNLGMNLRSIGDIGQSFQSQADAETQAIARIKEAEQQQAYEQELLAQKANQRSKHGKFVVLGKGHILNTETGETSIAKDWQRKISNAGSGTVKKTPKVDAKKFFKIDKDIPLSMKKKFKFLKQKDPAQFKSAMIEWRSGRKYWVNPVKTKTGKKPGYFVNRKTGLAETAIPRIRKRGIGTYQSADKKTTFGLDFSRVNIPGTNENLLQFGK